MKHRPTTSRCPLFIIGLLLFELRAIPVRPEIPASHLIGPGDQLVIVVDGEPTLSVDRTVDDQGGFEYPYLKYVVAEGTTAMDLARSITKRLIDEDFLKNPKVNVFIRYSPRSMVVVEGAVDNPGAHPLPPDRHLRSLLDRLRYSPDAGPRLLVQRIVMEQDKTVTRNLILERAHIESNTAVANILNITLEAEDQIWIERKGPIQIISVTGTQQIEPNNTNSIDLQAAIAECESSWFTPRMKVAVIDRIGKYTKVWFTELSDILRKDPRANEELWPFTVCFLLDEQSVAVLPSQGKPAILQAQQPWDVQKLRSTETFGDGLGTVLYWYPGDEGIDYVELEDQSDGIDRGVIVGYNIPVPTNQ